MLHFLQHIIPLIHPHIFAYETGTGTADITTLLSLTDGSDSAIVFLDLEKATLNILAEKGVKGNFSNGSRTTSPTQVKFQGHTSDSYSFENGTPLGGLLSPFPFPNNTSRLC